MSRLTGHVLGAPSTTPTVTFNFGKQASINGIRLFGTAGGTAGDEAGAEGFLGVFEVEVYHFIPKGTVIIIK